MKISSNIPAMMGVGYLNKANINANKAMQRLSSGLKINSAGDDPAGLAIANKLSIQKEGLSKATDNVMNGISLIQTAEGALNEVHDMLNRVRELSVQGINGSLAEDDREKIQEEIDALLEEIKSTSKNTKYNGIKMLDTSEEMTNYTQYNVISQSGISMLAQANQRPQQVLQLLNS